MPRKKRKTVEPKNDSIEVAPKKRSRVGKTPVKSLPKTRAKDKAESSTCRRSLRSHTRRQPEDSKDLDDSGATSKFFAKQEAVPNDLSQDTIQDTSQDSDNDIFNDNASNSSSDHGDWEEVEMKKPADDVEEQLKNYEPEIPTAGVDVYLNKPIKADKKQKKKQDINDIVRQHINRFKRANQLNQHKVSLLMLLARVIHLDRVIKTSDLISAQAFSIVADESFPDKLSMNFVIKFVDWFRSQFRLVVGKEGIDCCEEEGEEQSEQSDRSKSRCPTNINSSDGDSLVQQELSACFESRVARKPITMVLAFISLLRCADNIHGHRGLNFRLCQALNPVALKPTDLISSAAAQKRSKGKCKSSKSPSEEPSTSTSLSAGVGASSEASDRSTKKKTAAVRRPQKMKNDADKSSGSVNRKSNGTEKGPLRRSTRRRMVKKKDLIETSDSREISEDDDKGTVDLDDDDSSPSFAVVIVDDNNDNNGSAVVGAESTAGPEEVEANWAEIFLPADKKWISVDVVRGVINDPPAIARKLPHSLSYVIGIDNFGHVKELTQRYADDWMSSAMRHRRVDDNWWSSTLRPYQSPVKTSHDTADDEEFARILAKKPLPKRLADYKNHPLYVLQRDLLKFQVIYPPDAPTLGFFRNEPVFSRDCVHTCRGRDTWLRHARVVRDGEVCYKVVTSRPKWDKYAKRFIRDLPLEVFGEWQTEPYDPPTAVDGKVPRNKYGNVDLFQPEMLPKGCVYLKLPGLCRIANKLKIDCVPAVVGFDGACKARPVEEGFVVCQEYEDILTSAWQEEQVNIERRSNDKKMKRVYGNWRRLTRGLLIRQRIRKQREQDEEYDDDVVAIDDEPASSSMAVESVAMGERDKTGRNDGSSKFRRS